MQADSGRDGVAPASTLGGNLKQSGVASVRRGGVWPSRRIRARREVCASCSCSRLEIEEWVCVHGDPVLLYTTATIDAPRQPPTDSGVPGCLAWLGLAERCWIREMMARSSSSKTKDEQWPLRARSFPRRCFTRRENRRGRRLLLCHRMFRKAISIAWRHVASSRRNAIEYPLRFCFHFLAQVRKGVGEWRW